MKVPFKIWFSFFTGFEVFKNESDCRQLPDILIIGFEKCGTMTLRQFLGLHPSIFITKKRGNNDCFDEDESRAPIQCVEDRPCTDIGQLRLEKLGIGGESEKVFRYLPTVKLIVIVREPVERTMSHFVDVKARSKIPDDMDFEQFLKIFFPQNKTYSKNVRHLYTYTRLIKQWIKLFGKDKILILDGDKFARNPVVELRKAEVFLGLNSYFNEDVFVYNETRKFYCFKTDTGNECMYPGKGRPHPVMRNETRALLKTLFQSLNEEFFQLIGRRFPWNDT